MPLGKASVRWFDTSLLVMLGHSLCQTGRDGFNSLRLHSSEMCPFGKACLENGDFGVTTSKWALFLPESL